MRIAILSAIAALVVGCSDADHPPQAPGNPVANQLPGDLSGLVAHNAQQGDGGTSGEESLASTEQALTNCVPPYQVTRRLSNIVITSAKPAATCPAAWYANWDPMAWKQGMPFFDDQGAMSVPAGACQLNSRAFTSWSCQMSEIWSCPNGVWYSSVMTAVTADWGRTKVALTGTDIDGSCKRTARADFNTP